MGDHEFDMVTANQLQSCHSEGTGKRHPVAKGAIYGDRLILPGKDRDFQGFGSCLLQWF
jgi:hypothetical protein